MLSIVWATGTELVWPLLLGWGSLMRAPGSRGNPRPPAALPGIGWTLGVLTAALCVAAVLIDWYL